MNEDRLAGAAENLGGRATSAIGTLVGDDRMVARGDAHRVSGKLRNVLGSVWEVLGLEGGPLKRAAASLPHITHPTEITDHRKDKSMNEDEIKGGLRNVKGQVEKAVGDATTDTKWQADGVVDQVAGSAQKLYGRAKETVQDAVADAPNALSEANERVKDVASRGRALANDQLQDKPWVLVAAAGVVGYALSWILHGRRS